MKKSILIIFTTLFVSQMSHAFVENVTHGYSNCMSCHYSPSGGDLLTDYGRSLSGEMMSTWGGTTRVKDALFGLYKESKWARVGGDSRLLQTYINNDTSKSGKLFFMQNNVELGLSLGKATFVSTFGVQEGPRRFAGRGDFISERHYILVETSEQSRLRVGKFRTNFGINDPNHTRPTKSALGFGSLSEVYNIEFTKLSANWEFQLIGSFGRIDLGAAKNREKSITTNFVHYLGGKSRLGAHVLYGRDDNRERVILGASGVFPITSKLFGMAEIDYQRSWLQGSKSDLLTSHSRLGYELYKGVKFYGMFDWTQRDLAISPTRSYAPGIGIQFLPIPHFEFQLEYRRLTLESSAGDPNDVFWILSHFYL